VDSVLNWKAALIVAALAAPCGEVSAQVQLPIRSLAPSTSKAPSRTQVPASHMPPSGMCRIWIENVPPAQQPAPTDCASAIKNRPSNGRVIFSEDGDRRNEKGDSARGAGEGKTGQKPRKPSK